MKCIICNNISYLHICKKCQNKYLQPSIYKRKIIGNTDVISFYKYSEIKDLILTKHTVLGYFVYNIIAQNSFKKFSQNFNYKHSIASIGIDDNAKNSYSHTAILNKALKSRYITPLYSKLRAKNQISYAGKTREFRFSNPRNFIFEDFKQNEVILVDDIITTGSTLTQALNLMQKQKKEVVFCLTIADVGL